MNRYIIVKVPSALNYRKAKIRATSSDIDELQFTILHHFAISMNNVHVIFVIHWMISLTCRWQMFLVC